MANNLLVINVVTVLKFRIVSIWNRTLRRPALRRWQLLLLSYVLLIEKLLASTKAISDYISKTTIYRVMNFVTVLKFRIVSIWNRTLRRPALRRWQLLLLSYVLLIEKLLASTKAISDYISKTTIYRVMNFVTVLKFRIVSIWNRTLRRPALRRWWLLLLNINKIFSYFIIETFKGNIKIN